MNLSADFEEVFINQDFVIFKAKCGALTCKNGGILDEASCKCDCSQITQTDGTPRYSGAQCEIDASKSNLQFPSHSFKCNHVRWTSISSSMYRWNHLRNRPTVPTVSLWSSRGWCLLSSNVQEERMLIKNGSIFSSTMIFWGGKNTFDDLFVWKWNTRESL